MMARGTTTCAAATAAGGGADPSVSSEFALDVELWLVVAPCPESLELLFTVALSLPDTDDELSTLSDPSESPVDPRDATLQLASEPPSLE